MPFRKSIMWWFRCPDCKDLGAIDEDQLEGRVSILCECGYHKQGVVKPTLLTTESVNAAQLFTVGRVGG